MAGRRAGAGRVGLRAMLSAEPWTIPGCGSLNQLATGEMCEGDTIHDRQHPHDLFMELAGDYDGPLRGSLRWQIYAGLAGEPALGPVGFPHRLSAAFNPIARISHHWIDATHITFGLVTTGIYDRRWKAEVSVFNGREPDEDRADSISDRSTPYPCASPFCQRTSWPCRSPPDTCARRRPSSTLTPVPTSTGRLPRPPMHRILSSGGLWATTLALGVNSGHEIIPTGEFNATTFALMLETNANVTDRHTWLGQS